MVLDIMTVLTFVFLFFYKIASRIISKSGGAIIF